VGQSDTFPIIIITTYCNTTPRRIAFQDLYAIKNEITSLQLLWDFNSYFINIPIGYFIINGGNRIRPMVVEGMEIPVIEYAKRNRVDMALNTIDDPDKTNEIKISYLIGITGLCDGVSKSVLLHISDNGSVWSWRDSR